MLVSLPEQPNLVSNLFAVPSLNESAFTAIAPVQLKENSVSSRLIKAIVLMKITGSVDPQFI